MGGVSSRLAILFIPCAYACSAGGSSKPNASNASGGAAGAFVVGTGGDTTNVASGGASSGAGGVASTGTGGSTASGPHDPTLFAWPEGNPDAGAGGLCHAGHYVGTYSCDVHDGDAGSTFNYSLTGPVDLTLQQGQSGEFLSVSGGTLKSAAGILSLNADLIGQLDCQTGEFSGYLQNGTLAIPPFPPGGTFKGSLSATFTSNGPELVGSWTLFGEGQFAGYFCRGPWTATWQPN
jgi:hypothetical protein